VEHGILHFLQLQLLVVGDPDPFVLHVVLVMHLGEALTVIYQRLVLNNVISALVLISA